MKIQINDLDRKEIYKIQIFLDNKDIIICDHFENCN